MLKNHIKQRFHILVFIFNIDFCKTVFSWSINHWEIQLNIICPQIYKQIKYCINNTVRIRVRSVYLVYYYDWLQSMLQSLLQYIFSLRHYSFKRIYKQQYRIHHFQYSLHFPTKIGMPRSINYIYLVTFIVKGCIFWKDSYSSFPFQIITVHNSFFHFFMCGKCSWLLQQSIHQSCLTMIDMGYNCYIFYLITHFPTYIKYFETA